MRFLIRERIQVPGVQIRTLTVCASTAGVHENHGTVRYLVQIGGVYALRLQNEAAAQPDRPDDRHHEYGVIAMSHSN